MTKYSGIAEKVIGVLLIGGPIIGAIFGGHLGRQNEWNGTASSVLGLFAGLGVAILLLAVLILLERFVNNGRD